MDLCAMLVELVGRIPSVAYDEETGEGLGVQRVELRLPIEARIESADLWVSAPRGRLATGFDTALGLLAITLEQGSET